MATIAAVIGTAVAIVGLIANVAQILDFLVNLLVSAPVVGLQPTVTVDSRWHTAQVEITMTSSTLPVTSSTLALTPTPTWFPAFREHLQSCRLTWLDRELDKAEEECKIAIDLNPDDPSAYAGLGDVYESMRQFQDAILQYRRAISKSRNECDEAYMPSRYGLGNAYYSLHEYDRAISNYEEALSAANLCNDAVWRVNAHHALGKAYIVQRMEELAEYHFEEAISTYEESPELPLLPGGVIPDAHFEMAAIYSEKGENDQAILHWQKVIELSPSSDLAAAAQRLINEIE